MSKLISAVLLFLLSSAVCCATDLDASKNNSPTDISSLIAKNGYPQTWFENLTENSITIGYVNPTSIKFFYFKSDDLVGTIEIERESASPSWRNSNHGG